MWIDLTSNFNIAYHRDSPQRRRNWDMTQRMRFLLPTSLILSLIFLKSWNSKERTLQRRSGRDIERDREGTFPHWQFYPFTFSPYGLYDCSPTRLWALWTKDPVPVTCGSRIQQHKFWHRVTAQQINEQMCVCSVGYIPKPSGNLGMGHYVFSVTLWLLASICTEQHRGQLGLQGAKHPDSWVKERPAGRASRTSSRELNFGVVSVISTELHHFHSGNQAAWREPTVTVATTGRKPSSRESQREAPLHARGQPDLTMCLECVQFSSI